MTRNEEPSEAKQRHEEEGHLVYEFARANIDAVPPDKEIVNSETDELYESTSASTEEEDATLER